QPALAAVGVGGAINFFTNGLDTLTKGVEAVASYHANLGNSGILDLTLAYTHNENSVSNAQPNVISTAQIMDVKYLAPMNRATLTAEWSHGPISINAQEHYYGSWQDAVDYPTDPAGAGTTAQIFGAKFTTDLSASYKINKNFTFTLGGMDLFNTKPDPIAQNVNNPIFPITGGTSDGQVYPRLGGPFGFNGGFWYARVQIKY
ncbi:MAG: TonB-dependent receptor, partial [Alphaproteobacteria bacterium]|nr:TonB-dependent receptor [Alphaproteobacteria bacterium]